MSFVTTMMLVQKSLVEFTLETSKSYVASDHSFILWVFVMVPGTGVLQLCVQLPFLSAGLWSNFRIHLGWLPHTCKLVVIIYKIGKMYKLTDYRFSVFDLGALVLFLWATACLADDRWVLGLNSHSWSVGHIPVLNVCLSLLFDSFRCTDHVIL